jgi:hypothetical protein
MTLDDAVRVPVAVLPARSFSVVAGVYTHEPDEAVVLTWVHDPPHAPVTVNVTVVLLLLSASVPA